MSRKLVAVGTPRLRSMLATMSAPAPRMGSPTSGLVAPPAAGSGAAGSGWAGAGAAPSATGGAGGGGGTGAACGRLGR